MSSDMLLSPVTSPARTGVFSSPPLAPLSHCPLNVPFPALPFVAYSSSNRTRCSACHQPILLGDIRVDCLHLDCVSSAHVGQWLDAHPQLTRTLMRLPSLASLSVDDSKRAALLLHTLAQQCIDRNASQQPAGSGHTQRPPPLQPLSSNEHLPPIREDSLLSPTPLTPPSNHNHTHNHTHTHTHLLSPSRLIRQRTAPTSASFHFNTAAFHPSFAAVTSFTSLPAPLSSTALSMPGHKRKRVASNGTVQVVESEWPEPTLLSPVDSDSVMGGSGGSGRKKRRRSHEFVSMLT